MWPFTKKCPICGSKLQPTGYSWPYPPYRCNNCISINKLKKELNMLKEKINNHQ